MSERCHAGADHGPASSRGVWGWLCDDCYARVLALVVKLRGPGRG